MRLSNRQYVSDGKTEFVTVGDREEESVCFYYYLFTSSVIKLTTRHSISLNLQAWRRTVDRVKANEARDTPDCLLLHSEITRQPASFTTYAPRITIQDNDVGRYSDRDIQRPS